MKIEKQNEKIEKINELNDYLNIKDESSNILERVRKLERLVYDSCIDAELNLKSNLNYLNYINNIYKKEKE